MNVLGGSSWVKPVKQAWGMALDGALWLWPVASKKYLVLSTI
jgi:hypothetical protein